jgi:serine/threonine-protein phosphatase 2B catalytic subunit
MLTFDHMPLAAIVNGKFFAVHGGIGPNTSLETVAELDRKCEPPKEGVICDLLWSDPEVDKKGVDDSELFLPNIKRGCSCKYSYSGACKFLQKNDFLAIIRAHEVQQEGYKMHQENKKTGFPCVITVFSAPNYCDAYNNRGAVLMIQDDRICIRQFECSPHPYHLPQSVSLMSWSLPFVSEKVVEILQVFLQTSPDDDTTSLLDDDAGFKEVLSQITGAHNLTTGRKESAKKEQRESIRQKISAMAKLHVVLKHVREKREEQIANKDRCVADRLDAGSVRSILDDCNAGTERRDGVDSFERMKRLDSMNERRPDEDDDEDDEEDDEDEGRMSSRARPFTLMDWTDASRARI